MKWRGPHGGGAASGAYGASVASRARSTQYLRSRVKPVNPRTAFQTAVRNALKSLSQRWSNFLSGAQRTAWTVYASNVTTVNAIGDTQNLSGVNWYVGNNTVRLQAGLPAIDSAPSTFDVGNPVFIGATFTALGTSGTLNLGTTSLPLDSGTNGELILYATRPFAPGRTASPGGTRLCGLVAGNNTTVIQTFTLPFAADSVNQMQLVVRLSRGDGRLSSPFTFPKS